MKGLNIHLKSFKLNQNLVNSNDKVRVSITTFPEGNKEAFITEAKQMNSVNHDFKVNITDKTQDIVVVFRRMEILQDPIFASATISSKELPTTLNKIENKSFEIYEPAQKSNKDRHVVGQMQIQFTLTAAFPTSQSKENNQKKKTKKNFYSELDEKNEEIPSNFTLKYITIFSSILYLRNIERQHCLLLTLINNLPTVKYICDHLENVDIDPSIQCKAAVHWICKSKNPEIVKTVISKGIDVNRLDSECHPGPFHLLDLTDEDTVIKILDILVSAGLDLNIRGTSVDGRKVNTILGDFVSSIFRPIKVVEWLLENGAQYGDMLVSRNKRIIDFALNAKNRKLMEVFKYAKDEMI